MKIKKVLILSVFSLLSIVYAKETPFIVNNLVEGKELNIQEKGKLKIFFKNKDGLISETPNGYYWKYEYSLAFNSRKKFLENISNILKSKEVTILYIGEDYLFFKFYENEKLYWGKIVYFKENFHLEILEEKSLEVNKVLKSIVLKNLKFDSGKASLKKGAKGEIDRIVEFLVTNSTYIVEIQGHTDNIGSSEGNLLLSEKRAMRVKEILITKGIIRQRLQSKGYGETLPLWDNKTEDGRYRNRRVELKVLSQ